MREGRGTTGGKDKERGDEQAATTSGRGGSDESFFQVVCSPEATVDPDGLRLRGNRMCINIYSPPLTSPPVLVGEKKQKAGQARSHADVTCRSAHGRLRLMPRRGHLGRIHLHPCEKETSNVRNHMQNVSLCDNASEKRRCECAAPASLCKNRERKDESVMSVAVLQRVTGK